MKYLSIDEVYFLHALLIKKIGGREGIREFTLLHSAVSRPAATFGREDLYPDVYAKAAALIHSLILNHPFEDGNKRTGFFSLNAFLQKNDFRLLYTKQEGLKFCLGIESRKMKFGDIVSWIKKHARKK